MRGERKNTWTLIVSGLTLLVAGFALWVAYKQLERANASLRAANAIDLTRESREVAEQIGLAQDSQSRRIAFGRYGNLIATAGYLNDRGLIDAPIWSSFLDDFCQMLIDSNIGNEFGDWYTMNIRAEQFNDLYPRFRYLRSSEAKCPEEN